MTLMEKLTAAAEQVPLVYEAGKAICPTKHFVTTVTGDGSKTLSVHIPFKPDFIAVHSFDPMVYASTGAVTNFSLDLRALSYLVAALHTSRGDNPFSAMLLHSTLHTRYTRSEDGTVTLYGFPCSLGSYSGFFLSGAPYVVVAVKYTDQTDAERLTAFMQSLAGKNASLILSKITVTSVFPGADEENPETGESMNEAWNSLVKNYASGCTIALD